MPGMPDGKAAGQWCLHLTDERQCALFDDPRRPQVCSQLQPSEQMCGDNKEHALQFLADLERLTT
jgi:hypothetical protein